MLNVFWSQNTLLFTQPSNCILGEFEMLEFHH